MKLQDTPLWLLERISEGEVFDHMLIDNPNLRWNSPYTKPNEYVISGPYWGDELKALATDIYGKIICIGGKPDLLLIHCHAESSQIHLLRHWLHFCGKLGVNPNVIWRNRK